MSDSVLNDALIITLLLFFTTVTFGWFGSALNPAMGQDMIKLF